MKLDDLDHIHVLVANRAAAESWYAGALDLKVSPTLAHWAKGGPLMLENETASVRLALFQGDAGGNGSVIAFRVGAAEIVAWNDRLRQCLDEPPRIEDHGAAVSIYFSDPDGNPFEITTYDVEDGLKERLGL